MENRKFALRMHFLLVGVIFFVTSQVFAGNRTVKPNVILIVADDMGYGDMASVNGSRTHTPNIDDLKSNGAWFENAYSAAPVCAPARASLLTGMYPHRTGCVTLNMQRFPEFTRMHGELTTLADVFKANGYRTGLVGKWHTGEGEGYEPLQRGFDEFEGFFGYDVPDYFDYYLRVQNQRKRVQDKYLTHDLSQRAIDFVRRHQKEPFFLHLAHYAPHRPLGAPENTVSTYLEKGFDTKTATIYAMIEEMDRGIGQLMSELRELGLSEKTLIIFTSDNGPDPLTGQRFNNLLRGNKYTVYEGGLRVPFVFYRPGIIEPARIEEVVHFADVFPTLMNECGLKTNLETSFDGVSFSRLLYGKEAYLPAFRCWQWNRGIPVYSHNAAIRQGKWKLVKPFISHWEVMPAESNEKPVLFDLENDPGETTDVSDDNKEIYDELRVRLEHWSRKVEKDRLQ